jgi:cell division transport system permease protein
MHRFAHYLGLHASNLRSAAARISGQPLGSAMTVLVIAIALALPAGLRVLLDNAQSASAAWEGAADFTVYLEDDVEEARGRALAATIEKRDDVSRVEFVSRTDAFEEFRAHSGLGEALDALEDNPLPHALVVRPASGAQGDVEALAAALDALEETALVQLDTAWVDRLRAMLRLAARAVDVATILLGLGVVLVIGNTIRLEINGRREEIVVVKLVGGSDAFVRRPFLYLGLLYGASGAALAALLVELSLLVLGGPVRGLAGLYGSAFELEGLGLRGTATLVGAGALLGWAGAGLATARHLRAIEPQ